MLGESAGRLARIVPGGAAGERRVVARGIAMYILGNVYSCGKIKMCYKLLFSRSLTRMIAGRRSEAGLYNPKRERRGLKKVVRNFLFESAVTH
jgi:hypothetical protein